MAVEYAGGKPNSTEMYTATICIEVVNKGLFSCAEKSIQSRLKAWNKCDLEPWRVGDANGLLEVVACGGHFLRGCWPWLCGKLDPRAASVMGWCV